MSPRSSSAKAKKGAKAKAAAGSPDVYVAMLFVSVASLIAGVSLLVFELYRYNWMLPGG